MRHRQEDINIRLRDYRMRLQSGENNGEVMIPKIRKSQPRDRKDTAKRQEGYSQETGRIQLKNWKCKAMKNEGYI